ncbi:DUF998 domain-containing protein [Galbibacter pacificus]|uniref:DUF998 domain-containing protein n=1 Tax=Galbibacter pacificus TaxID=2996052 RepID=A0ABT6FWK4_9FLAO|nr:DUF998 domain-containing protein [Galbibacter pacificus]MDG3584183.1 DUF998 domain-containing protein [Galbibacter pacificus]MDG3587636.1 DUF998 domain-containing protein [Galbibacter pacificus]
MNKLTFSKYSAVGFVSILFLLHIINTTVNPTWQPISEYALGEFGWLMNLAFILLGCSFAFSGMFLIQKFTNIGSKIGGILLLLASVGNFLAGFFNTDPITTSPENITVIGQIHSGAAGLLGLMIIATIFVTIQFYKQPSLKPFKISILLTTTLVWLAELILVGGMGYYLSKTNGMITEDTPIGWYGRIVIVLCAVWCYVCANNLQKANFQRT